MAGAPIAGGRYLHRGTNRAVRRARRSPRYRVGPACQQTHAAAQTTSAAGAAAVSGLTQRVNVRAPPHSTLVPNAVNDDSRRSSRQISERVNPPVRPLGARRAAEPDGPPSDEGLDLDPGPARQEEFERLVRRQLELVGEDPAREGLVKTPQRVANALAWLTRGYDESVHDVVGDAVFEEAHENMVMVRDIELYSLCEHHMLPFFGRAHVAYIPDRRIVGLSKLPRIVDVFARRLQVQERLPEQIASAVVEVLEPHGVGVVIEAFHLCMMMRGVEKQNSKTITSALRGSFRDDPKTRDEFLRLAHTPMSV
jgi:GTP cyclohydrolase IA